jgi:preprotein translocase subunit Sec63
MINQIAKTIILPCFKNRNHFIVKNRSPLISKVKFGFFNSGKYDLKKDYYAILGLTKTVDQNLIKKEYYKLAKQYHPDVNPSASEKFKLINEAYGVLSDEKVKA